MARSLADRLAAISRTHDALTRRDWAGQGLRALAEAETAPFVESGDGRFAYTGDDLLLDPSTALSFGLALHEIIPHGLLQLPQGAAWLVVGLMAFAMAGLLGRPERE